MTIIFWKIALDHNPFYNQGSLRRADYVRVKIMTMQYEEERLIQTLHLAHFPALVSLHLLLLYMEANIWYC